MSGKKIGYGLFGVLLKTVLVFIIGCVLQFQLHGIKTSGGNLTIE
jgi:hypothetical protein